MLTRFTFADGRFFYGCCTRAAGRRDWVVYLPESGAAFQSGSRAELKQHVGADLAARLNYLVVNKAGLRPRGKDLAVFDKAFRRDLRVRDALAAMKRLIPAGSKIYLIGYSEGAYLAPEIARRDRRVAGVAMIGGGTRGWLKEELAQARPKEREGVARQIRQIYRENHSDQRWHDFTYATWFSYREDRTLKALRGLGKPVLALLGARDRVIDLKAALTDLRALQARQPVQIRLLHGCGHEFTGHWNTVRRTLKDFVRDQLAE